MKRTVRITNKQAKELNQERYRKAGKKAKTTKKAKTAKKTKPTKQTTMEQTMAGDPAVDAAVSALGAVSRRYSDAIKVVVRKYLPEMRVGMRALEKARDAWLKKHDPSWSKWKDMWLSRYDTSLYTSLSRWNGDKAAMAEHIARMHSRSADPAKTPKLTKRAHHKWRRPRIESHTIRTSEPE